MGHNTCKSMGRVLCVVRRQRLKLERQLIFDPWLIGPPLVN